MVASIYRQRAARPEVSLGDVTARLRNGPLRAAESGAGNRLPVTWKPSDVATSCSIHRRTSGGALRMWHARLLCASCSPEPFQFGLDAGNSHFPRHEFERHGYRVPQNVGCSHDRYYIEINMLAISIGTSSARVFRTSARITEKVVPDEKVKRTITI
jgi:hypothetical protein